MDHQILERNRSQCAAILERLLAAQQFAFDDSLKSQLPLKQGLYAIGQKNGDHVESLHAGQSRKADKGLRSRVWEQHFTQGAGSDLVQKVRDNQKAVTRENAKEWIRKNCFVQWVVEEDGDLRCWAEHYILSVLRPIWGR